MNGVKTKCPAPLPQRRRPSCCSTGSGKTKGCSRPATQTRRARRRLQQPLLVLYARELPLSDAQQYASPCSPIPDTRPSLLSDGPAKLANLLMRSGVSAPLRDAADGCPHTRCTWPRAAAIHDSFRDEVAGVAQEVPLGMQCDARLRQ